MMMSERPFSPSCERNQGPILGVLKEILSSRHQCLLEVGSGTGQHAVYFAPNLPHMTWTTSDIRARHAGIKAWLEDARLSNIEGPIAFEVGLDPLPSGRFDAVFSANVLHIMSWEHCKILIKGFGASLATGSDVIFYGPFNYGGEFTSASNQAFDNHLKRQDPDSGIRDFEKVRDLMKDAGFSLVRDYEMPANNRILHFKN